MSSDSSVPNSKRCLAFSPAQVSGKQHKKRTRVDPENMTLEAAGMECIPEDSTMDSNAPDTDFDVDIGSIHTNILTRVNEALSQRGSVEEGSDKCFVQQMLPAIVTSVALAVGEVMKGFLKRMPKPADVVNVERSAVVQNLQRNVLLMRHEKDRLEQYN